MIQIAKSQLDSERRFYNRNREEFLEKYKSKFVLIKKEKLIGVFDTNEEAYSKGLELFGNEPMFIKQVQEDESTPLVFGLSRYI